MNNTNQPIERRTFCPQCLTEADYEVLRRPVSIEFRGKTYQSEEEVARCSNCGEEFDMFHLLDPLTNVYDQYRREHGFPAPEQIRILREAMHQTEETFGRLLGVDSRTIRLYEKGALPTDAHGRLLSQLVRLLCPPMPASEKVSETPPMSTWTVQTSVDWRIFRLAHSMKPAKVCLLDSEPLIPAA